MEAGLAWPKLYVQFLEKEGHVPTHPVHPVFMETNLIPSSAASSRHPRGSCEATEKGRLGGRRAHSVWPGGDSRPGPVPLLRVRACIPGEARG